MGTVLDGLISVATGRRPRIGRGSEGCFDRSGAQARSGKTLASIALPEDFARPHCADRHRNAKAARRCLVSWFAGLLISVAMAAPASGQSAGTFAFDPESCREDTEETIYVTLYGTVFRLPLDHIHGGAAVPSDSMERFPPAVDETEPLGCPDNPLPGLNFSISIPRAKGITFQAPEDAGIRFREDVIPVRRLLIRAVPTDHFDAQRSHEQIAERSCEIGLSRNIAPHLRECLVPQDDGSSSSQWPGSYVTDESHYSSPYGDPFIASCRAIRFRQCNVSYKYFDTVNIDYRFDTRFIRPEQFVAVDRVIREHLDAWRVPPPISETP